jgi:hypothetical protein
MEIGVQTDPPGQKVMSEATRRKMGDAKRGVPRDPEVMKRVVETKRRLRELYTAEQLAERSRQRKASKKLVGRPIVYISPEDLAEKNRVAAERSKVSRQRGYLRMVEKAKEEMLAEWKASYEANKQKDAANEIIQLNSQQVIVPH